MANFAVLRNVTSPNFAVNLGRNFEILLKFKGITLVFRGYFVEIFQIFAVNCQRLCNSFTVQY